MVRKLIRMAKAQPKKTARQVIVDYHLSKLVSADTTKHIPQEHGPNEFISAKKPSLKTHLMARLNGS